MKPPSGLSFLAIGVAVVLATPFHALSQCVSMLCPSNMVVTCESPTGEIVHFNVQATNHCGKPVNVYCDPPSGSVFPLGLSTVVCTADTREINPPSCFFTIEVVDETPPIIVCPDDVAVLAQSAAGQPVFFSVTATDDCDTNVTIQCLPPRGSVFPIGETLVQCIATDDSGNRSVCGFSVRLSLRPLTIAYLSPNVIRVGWIEPGHPQYSESLEDPDWRALPPAWPGGQSDTKHWVDVPIGLLGAESAAFFRLRADPVLPEVDSDQDGVEDKDDKCAQTLPLESVDACGCSKAQVIQKPEGITGGPMARIQEIGALLGQTGKPDFQLIQETLTEQLAAFEQGLSLFRSAQLQQGDQAARAAISAMEDAHEDLLESLEVLRVELELNSPGTGDASDADVKVAIYRIMADQLGAAIGEVNDAVDSMVRVRQSVYRTFAIEGTVLEVDASKRFVQMGYDDGAGDRFRVDLAEIPYEEAIYEGRFVQVTGIEFDDGTRLAEAFSVEPGIPFPGILRPYLIQCMQLRVAPVQRFPPLYSGPYTLHHPSAYEHNGTLWLEEGMRLGVAQAGNCPDTTSGGDPISYGVKLHLEYRNRNSVLSRCTLATRLQPHDDPVELPFVHPAFPATLTMRLLRWSCHVEFPSVSCTDPQEIGVVTYELRVQPRFSYASAVYESLLYDLEDSRNETGFRSARVLLVNPNSSVLDNVSDVNFEAEAYRVFLVNSTRPVPVKVGLSEPFAIYTDDFFDPNGFLQTETWGVTNAAGLIWPHATGRHQGRTYAYSCGLPTIVRDLVSLCPAFPHTFYRLPFKGGWPTWMMGQGNNDPSPNATHCPTCYNRFAFDFVANQGTKIYAARGGVVLGVDESQSGNCWNAGLNRCDNPCDNPANIVTVRHQDGSIGVYMHMRQNGVYVNAGDRVYRGDLIAEVGNTGCSSNPHLHFQVDPFLGAPQSGPVGFAAWNVCENDDEFFRCDPMRSCFVPERGDILFSTQ